MAAFLDAGDATAGDLAVEARPAGAGVETLAFTGRLAPAGSFEEITYVVALVSSAASSALLIAPVAQHRMLLRLERKPYLVRSAHRMASCGLALLLVSMVASMLLAGGVVLPRTAAIAVAGFVGAWFVAWWVVAPWRERGPLIPAEPRVERPTRTA